MDVSIRCRARRAAEHHQLCLCCEQYSRFLFAVVRDAQRNTPRCVDTRRPSSFLFAVSCPRRAAEHGPAAARDAHQGRRVSIRCRARRAAERTHEPNDPETCWLTVSIRCRARRAAELSTRIANVLGSDPVSIRCRARRAAEPDRLQRCRSATGFYSLSCETRSGTTDTSTDAEVAQVSIRCRARRAAEPSARWSLTHDDRVSIRCRARRAAERHDVGATADRPEVNCFYSLSCETRSGTGPAHVTTHLSTGWFYSLSCETRSGTGPRG